MRRGPCEHQGGPVSKLDALRLFEGVQTAGCKHDLFRLGKLRKPVGYKLLIDFVQKVEARGWCELRRDVICWSNGG